MKITRIALILLLGILLASGLACVSDTRHDDLVALKAWHDKWDETVSQCCITEGVRVGSPDNEATFNELLAELKDIDPYGIPEYDDYLTAHQLFVVAVRHMYTMQQNEEERYSALGYDDYYKTPCCPWREIACSQQPDSTEYEQACTVERLARENLIRIRIEWELWGPFSELD